MPSHIQKKLFCFNKYVCVEKSLNLDICSKFWGNFEGIWEILGKYRVLDGRSMASKGLMPCIYVLLTT